MVHNQAVKGRTYANELPAFKVTPQMPNNVRREIEITVSQDHDEVPMAQLSTRLLLQQDGYRSFKASPTPTKLRDGHALRRVPERVLDDIAGVYARGKEILTKWTSAYSAQNLSASPSSARSVITVARLFR